MNLEEPEASEVLGSSRSRLSLFAGFSVFVFVWLVYSFTNYGGVRSPDGEIYFRTAEQLAFEQTFAISDHLVLWAGFGVTEGLDGRFYSIFGPGWPLMAVPAVWLAETINRSGWYENTDVPQSYYVGNGLADAITGRRPEQIEEHALRFLSSFYVPLIGALNALLFFMLVRTFRLSVTTAFGMSMLFALGTPAWSYAGMFLSETAATFFVLLSLLFMVRVFDRHARAADPNLSSSSKWTYGELLLSGVFLSAAVAVHVTAFLFVPFFILLPLLIHGTAWRIRITSAALFCVGLSIFGLALAYFNYERFGSIFETGRTAGRLDPSLAYGRLIAPWTGLYGLTLSFGKGLVFYAPVVVVGFLCWPWLHRYSRALSIVLLLSILFRIIFIASRSDWHGGFCLGPRYLIMTLPMLLIPLALALDAWWRRRKILFVGGIGLASLACLLQQAYFAFGEPIYFFIWQARRFRYSGRQMSAEAAAVAPYFEWEYSPLHQLWEAGVHPYFITRLHETLQMTIPVIWALCISVIVAFTLLMLYFIGRGERREASFMGADSDQHGDL